MNNSSSSILDDCGITNRTLEIASQLNFLSYVFFNQVYLIFGVAGNIILLIAFYKQSKTERAYGYQVYLAVSKTFETLSFSVFLTTLKRFSGAENNEASWFVGNYPIMYLTARLGPVAHMVFIVCSLLLTLAMTLDRLFALTKPFVYKNIDRSKHQAVAAALCFLIGLVSSVSDAWRYDVATVAPNHYKLVTNEQYVVSTVAIVTAHVRTGVRVIGVLGLIVFNGLVAVLFLKRSRRVAHMTNKGQANEQKEKTRRQAEKNLVLLNIYQSILMAINQIPHMGYHVLAYSIPTFTRCTGMIYSPTADAMVMLTDSIDLFILMGVNKKMRRSVLRGLACMQCCKEKLGEGAKATVVTGSGVARSEQPPTGGAVGVGKRQDGEVVGDGGDIAVVG